VGNALNNLAEVALKESAYGHATDMLVESLGIYRRLGDQRAIAFVLECYARVAAATGDPFLCLKLAGAAGAIRERIHSPLSGVEQDLLDSGIEPAVAAVSAETRLRLLEEGQALSTEAAMALVSEDAASRLVSQPSKYLLPRNTALRRDHR
jgi:hypothetical protein